MVMALAFIVGFAIPLVIRLLRYRSVERELARQSLLCGRCLLQNRPYANYCRRCGWKYPVAVLEIVPHKGLTREILNDGTIKETWEVN